MSFQSDDEWFDRAQGADHTLGFFMSTYSPYLLIPPGLGTLSTSSAAPFQSKSLTTSASETRVCLANSRSFISSRLLTLMLSVLSRISFPTFSAMHVSSLVLTHTQ